MIIYLKSQSHKLKMNIRSINDQESVNRVKLTEIKSKLNNIHVERCELLNTLETVLEKAREKGPRISTAMTLEQLPERIAKIKAQLKHGMPVNVDPNTISELIDTKKEALEADVGTYENINMSIHMVKIFQVQQNSYIQCLTKEKNFQKFICVLVERKFKNLFKKLAKYL